MQCTQCEILLEEYDSGTLAALEHEAVAQHLRQCDECATQLAYLFEVKLMSSRWQDEPVPSWNPRQIFSSNDPKSRYGKPENLVYLSWNQLLATAASIVLVTLVLVNFSVSKNGVQSLANSDGSNYDNNSNYVNYEELDNRFENLVENQNAKLAQVAYQLKSEQLESNQLLLNSLLKVGRQERHQDMNNLMATWVQFQGEQSEPTVQGLKYLLAKQQNDDLQLKQLRTAINKGSNKY